MNMIAIEHVHAVFYSVFCNGNEMYGKNEELITIVIGLPVTHV